MASDSPAPSTPRAPASPPAQPTFIDVLAARRRIATYLRPTPLYSYPGLDALVGAEVLVKHENHQPVAAFKVRGGINLVSQLDDATRARGLATASTGNHGQSIAFAARTFGVAATVFVPEGANPVKVAAIEGPGADVVVHGKDFDEARRHGADVAHAAGARWVHPGNEPDLIAGVATCMLEILQERPDVAAVVVPVGGGSGAAGAGLVAATIAPHVRVIGVQSAAAPAAHDSWRAGALVERPIRTVAEGLATGTAFELPQQMMRRHLADFVLVSDQQLLAAQVTLIEATRNLVESAGAAAFAAALTLREELAGKVVAVIVSGGNVSREQLAAVLGAEESGGVA